MLRSDDLERVSSRVRGMRISPTVAMSVRASTLKAAGRDIISLALGELDFDTPGRVIEAAHRAALGGMTRYTPPDGVAGLKAAIRAKLQRDSKLSFEQNEIHVASGAKQVIHNALAATLDPGDEVIIFSPYWVSYSDLVEFCGGRVVVVPTEAADGFLPDPHRLADGITPRTRWVLLNSPNNPTGAIYSRELINQLARVIEPYSSALVMSDEIYEHLAFDGRRHVSFVEAFPDLRERTLTINGVSKSYAMTGWRIGYAAGPSWLIGAMAKVQSQTAGNSCSIAQAAAEEALAGDQTLVSQWRDILETRRDRVTEMLSRSTWLKVSGASGAFYVFCDVSRCLGATTPGGKVLGTDMEVADFLLDVAGVATVAGEAFGTSPFIRISFALDIERLEAACSRIVATLDTLSPAPRFAEIGS